MAKQVALGGVAGRREENHGSFPEGAGQHFGQASSHKRMIDLELEKQNAAGREQRARFAEGLFGVDEVVETHVGIVGELSVGIEQSEKDEVVTGGGALHEGAGVGEVSGDARIVVGMFGVATAAEVEDFGIDFHGIDGASSGGAERRPRHFRCPSRRSGRSGSGT